MKYSQPIASPPRVWECPTAPTSSSTCCRDCWCDLTPTPPPNTHIGTSSAHPQHISPTHRGEERGEERRREEKREERTGKERRGVKVREQSRREERSYHDVIRLSREWSMRCDTLRHTPRTHTPHTTYARTHTHTHTHTRTQTRTTYAHNVQSTCLQLR